MTPPHIATGQRARLDRMPLTAFAPRVVGAAALDLPRGGTVTEWAEEHIRLSERSDAEGGRYSVERTPYARGILDAFGDSGVDQITFLKPTQVGGTTIELITACWAIDQDPGPSLFVMPIEDLARETSDERLQPMIRSSRTVAKHMSGNAYDFTKLRYRFDQMDLHLAWSNSASKLASKPKRYLWFDECNKYPAFTGSESDPISLGLERQRTFWNRKAMLASTPTTPGGVISVHYAASNQCTFRVKCPHCGEYQRLTFKGHVDWSEFKDATPEEISRDGLAAYICEHCEGRITDAMKPALIATGVWCPEGANVTKAGAVVGAKESRHWGFHLNALYSPWLSFSDVACKFLQAKGDPAKLMNVVNSWFAEEWEAVADAVEINTTTATSTRWKPGTVPDDSIVLTAGSDLQEDADVGYLYYTVRAWMPGELTWLVEEGRLERDGDGLTDMQQLADLVMGGTWPDAQGREHRVRLLVMDCAFRTDEAYRFQRQHPQRVWCARGANRRQAQPYVMSAVNVGPTRGRRRRAVHKGQPYLTIDGGYYKSLIARLCHEGKWQLPPDVSATYQRQFAAEHKVLSVDARGRQIETWELKRGFRANHLLDCEVNATAAADVLGYWTDLEMREAGAVAKPRPKVERVARVSKIRTQY